MKRRIVAAICMFALGISLAVPASAASPVGCSKKTSALSRYSRANSMIVMDSAKTAKSNACFDSLQSLLAFLNKECEIRLEIPNKPKAPAKPQTPVEPEASGKPQTPVEPETPAKPQTPVEPEAPGKPENQPEVTPPAESPEKPDKQGDAVGDYAQQVLDLVNKQRVNNGLPALTLSSGLSAVAQAKAQDMKDNKYFSHTSPTYGSPFDMMKAFGIQYRTAGENIAMGQPTPQAVVNAWMNSSGHRANILNANYTQMGLGYVKSGNYWCQMFIG